MLRSLIVQLCGRRPDSPEALLKLRRFRDTTHQPGLDELEATLRATTEGFKKVFLVIDALDECPEKDSEREILLKLIARIRRWSSSSLHFLCTSRKENDIERALQPLVENQNALIINLQVHREEVDRDIGIFIDQIISLSIFASWSHIFKAKVRTMLTEKADGMYVQIAFQFIQCLFSLGFNMLLFN
jgi:hypothetical protein